MSSVMVTDRSTLEAALIGYQRQIDDARQAIAEIQRQLNRRPAGAATSEAVDRKPRRKLSAAARKRIAAAQKKRWAAYKKAKALTGD